MRRLARDRRRSAVQQISETMSIPAPVRGWNTLDTLANMKPTDAIELDNWFPRESYCELRGGSAEHVTGLPDWVESLLPYSPPSGANILFAASDTGIYDVTTPGAVGAAVQSGLTNARWQSVNFATAGGTHYLVAVNGADNMRYYDGSSWITITGASTPAVTGPNTNTFIHVNEFKERLYFIPVNKLSFYYLPAASVGGAATEFPLGSFMGRGGFLMAMGTWSLDGGNGQDDVAVFWSSEGECVVFRGSNPGDPANWSLVGSFFIGKPIGRRCFVKWGGELLALTQAGIFPLSKALLSEALDRRNAFSVRIEPTFRQMYLEFGSTFGWDMTIHPAQSALIINMPDPLHPQQLVMNTMTKAWCRFTGWAARCFCEFEGSLYFGGDGVVALAWTGQADIGDAAIIAPAKQAYNYFKNRTQQKSWGLVRPIFQVTASIEFLMGLSVDFEETELSGTAGYSIAFLPLWDTAIWDTDFWGGEFFTQKTWKGPAAKPGFCASVQLKVATNAVQVRWAATDVSWTAGGTM